MTYPFLKTTCSALALAVSLVASAPAMATEVKAEVTQVQADATVQITLPAGVAVSAGDAVQIMTTIAGVGPVAITTLWHIQSVNGRYVIAIPEAAPSGTPQVGYIARIQTDAVAAQSATSPEIDTLFQNAQILAAPYRGPADLAQAVQQYRQAADKGHAGSMSALGVLHSFGRGVAQDDAAALSWHHKATQLGHAGSMTRLAMLYALGWGVPRDFDTAADWAHQAAALGDRDAMFVLFNLYEDGHGVDADLLKAVEWLLKAADAGHLHSMYYLGYIYEDGEDGVIAGDIRKAERFWIEAAQAGHVGAMRALMDLYEGDEGIPADPAAVDYWRGVRRQARKEQHPDISEPNCLAPGECYGPR